MIVELLRTYAADGIPLEGSLREPAPGVASAAPVDILIMHHGIGGNFYRESYFDIIAEEFLARGCAVIRANSRGHDLAYNMPPPLPRLGAAFETVDDCRLDWRAWIDLAEARGYGRIGVWGHSLGAVKTIYYLANEDDPRIVRAVASSPPRFSQSAFLKRAESEIFATSVREADRLAADGKFDAIFAIQAPTAALMSVRTFLDKYGTEERYDYLTHLPQVTTPLLITIGGLEGSDKERNDSFAFAGLADTLTERSASANNFTFRLIEGADHFYNGVTDRLWDAVGAWLDG